jgi:histone deacetylase 6
MNEYSDYTFNIIPDTQIPAGGTLEITFPSQFTLGLGIVIDPTSNNYCSLPCSVNNYIVIFTIQTVCLPGVMSSFTIYTVLNPPTKGGTGNFIITSKLGGVNILDENLVFGIIGIADSVNNLTSTTVALDATGSSEAGVLTKYSFSFKTNQIISMNSYFMITMPATSGFSLSTNPSCSSFAINGNQISGNLVCTSQSNNIIVQGLAQDIPSAFEVGISVSVTNPTYSGTTGTFQIAILKTNTTVVYAWSTGINGVTITPGTISKIVLSLLTPNLVLAMNKVLDFRLVFIPKNALISGSQILIQFPMASVTNCYMEFGINDITPTNPATCTPSGSSSLLISNFQEMDSPGEISITMRMTTLSNNGITTPVKIYTYCYMNSVQTIIDQDVTTATLTILNIRTLFYP